MKTNDFKNLRFANSELKRAKVCYEICSVKGMDKEAMYWYGYAYGIELMLGLKK